MEQINSEIDTSQILQSQQTQLLVTPKYVGDFLEGKIGDNDDLIEYNRLSIPGPQVTQTEVKEMLTPELKQKLIANISDLYTQSIYDSFGIHSTKHIEDVMTFSVLIGSSLGLDDNTLQLLLESAKYHDSGRVTDNDTKDIYYTSGAKGDVHGRKGAENALELLKGKYSEQELAIIATAIEYHALTGDNESALEEMCDRYGVDKNNQEIMDKLTSIAFCLKDADALDRTRFLGTTRSFIRPEFLRYDISKSLIKVSSQINERYAKIDIENMMIESPETREMVEAGRKNHHTPKEIIRAFRKHYVYELNKTSRSYVPGMEESEGLSNGRSR